MTPTTLPLRLLLMGSLVAAVSDHDPDWKCPELNEPKISCSCDLPHTLRCVVDGSTLPALADKLRILNASAEISLLDCTVENLVRLPGYFLTGVSLHGLVVTSGEIQNVSDKAFAGLLNPLQALGLPNNGLRSIPNLRDLSELERLDLSRNRISELDSASFAGLKSVTFVDLSDNEIKNVHPETFPERLQTLRLKGNRLRIATVSKLKNLNALQELDLSSNALVGALEKGTVLPVPSLKILSLANNQFNSVRQDALQGASSLSRLSLNNNQIDVLEDHAFRGVKHLKSLDLANNRIVAISGSSLAHLSELVRLDLSHNFLRALTADIVVPLISLRELVLDDNDISIIDGSAFSGKTLEKLTLSDNPLSCDCNLVDFLVWFNNATSIDRHTAVCATPPHLENALLMEISPKELKCEEDDSEPVPPAGPVVAQISGDHVALRAFHFDGKTIALLWKIDSKADPFTCDALFVYEDVSSREVLLSSTPIKCNSSQLVDPSTLLVRLPVGNLLLDHNYRYCVVLLQGEKHTDEMQLVLGCSEYVTLTVTNQSIIQPPRLPSSVRIVSLDANLSSSTLSVSVRLYQKKSSDLRCHVTVTIFMANSLLAQHHLNCSDPFISIEGLPGGLYHVCATLGNYPPSETRVQCVTVQENKQRTGNSMTLTLCFVLFSILILVGIYFAVKMLKRPKMTTHQCFLAPSDADEEEQRKKHLRYVKLQTTTKL